MKRRTMDAPRARLVLLPGLEGSGELFDGLTSELGSSFETRVVRYPHTASNYDELLPLIESVIAEAKPCFVLAESFSTRMAIRACADAPAGIRGLILCNGFVSNPLAGFESMMAAALAPWVLHLPLTPIASRTFLVGPDASEGLVEAVQSAIKPVSPAVMGARVQTVFASDARAALTQISIPMLYIHATRDRLIGGAGLREVQRIKPELEVAMVEGPHLLLQREPRRCAEIIRQFVGKLTATGSA